VTTTADCTGCGSLRDGIAAVNAGTADVIDATGVSGAIVLSSSLPSILNSVTINGSSVESLSISGPEGSVRIETVASVELANIAIGDALVKAGTGTLTLAGEQSYTGGTTVLAGTLAGTPSDHNGAGASLQGNIVNFGTIQVDRNERTAGRWYASISGPGSVVQTGDAWWQGSSSYTGGTTIAGGSATGNTRSLQGDFDIQGIGDLTFHQDFDGTFAGNVTSQTHPAGLDLIVGAGAGVITFSGDLDIAGDMAVSPNGTMRTTTASLLPQSAPARMMVYGTFELAQDFDGTLTRALTGTGTFIKSGSGNVTLAGDRGSFGILNTIISGGTLTATTSTIGYWVVNNATLNFAQNFDGVFTGEISGSGVFIKSGTGAVTLTGVNTYSGGTIVAAGELAGSTASVQGNILNHSRVRFDQATDGTYAGTMSGSGMLFKSGAGVLTLGAANSYSGGTFIQAGTLRMGHAGAVGAGFVDVDGTWDLNGFSVAVAGIGGDGEITLGSGALTVGIDSSTGTFDGVISGAGSLTKRGSGVLSLTGVNSYEGGTVLAGGVLAVSADGSLGSSTGGLTFAGGTLRLGGALSSARAITFESAGSFDTNGFTATLSGNMTGAGGFTKIGGGTLVLTGTNTYTGGTTVAQGALVGNTTSLQGEITNNALVIFDQGPDGSYAGAISGAGSLLKVGAGVLTLTGAQSYEGVTDVASGGLVLGGSLAGALVARDGTFIRLAPSDAGSTIAIGGDLTFFRGTTYGATLTASGTVSPLLVAGRAAIDGSTLELTLPAGAGADAARVATSLLLSAGAIDGGFGSISGQIGPFDPTLILRGNEIYLHLSRASIDFAQYATSANGAAVGAVFAAAQPAATGDLAFVLRELRSLATDSELAAALDQIAGSGHANAAGARLLEAADVADVVGQRFTGRNGPWVQALGSSRTLHQSIDLPAAASTSHGMLVGYDWGGWRRRAGIAAGYSRSDVDAFGDRGVDAVAYRAAAYGHVGTGPWFADAIVSGARHDVDGGRAVSFTARLPEALDSAVLFGGVNRRAEFAYGAFEWSGVIESGLRRETRGFDVRASAGLQAARLAREAFDETGADSLSLHFADQVMSSQAVRLRVVAERIGGRLRPRVDVRYAHELGSRDLPIGVSIAGSPFATAFRLPSDVVSGRAGLAIAFQRVSLTADYRIAASSGLLQHLFSLGVSR
jgi:autotransporter-associated beta strand protein